FGKHLEDIHVTWTQFGKKRDKITTLHEVALKICVQAVLGDGVTIPSDAVRMNKRRHQKNGDDVRTRTINQAASGKLREQNTKESYALLEDLALYENGSWNDPRDFAKSVKEISLPQDVSRTSDRRLIGLENQVLESLAHTPMYNEILDKYVESLELGKNGSAFIQGKMLEKIKDPELFTLPCSLGNSKPFDTLADIGSN
ncbi:hypothetical protein Tco_1128447, partial [Tanacetum coccineum]